VLLKVLKGKRDAAPPAMLELRVRFECLHPISKGRIMHALEDRLHGFEEQQKEERPERERFEQALPGAVKTFEHVFFGRAVKPRVDKKTGRVLNLHYDDTFWEETPDPEFDTTLKLKSGTKPSVALEAMAAQPKKWSFDCAEWVQVAENFAWLKALGADEFDKRMASLQEFRLRPQWSGVSQPEVKFQRVGPTAKFSRVTGPVGFEDDERTAEELLRDAPIGSRVTWSSTVGDLKDWQHENTVKVGDDQYAAHGFPGQKTFTAAQLELHYGEKIEKIKKIDSQAAYDSVFLEVVEFYKTPGKAP
jgi:hypothetical protein